MAVMEVRAFGKLYFLFKEREWPNPLLYKMEEDLLTAEELREKLEIPSNDVEAVFINRLIRPLSTRLQPGDRVAFVPPGVPSIHRFNLGFYDAKEGRQGNSICRDSSRAGELDPTGGNGGNGNGGNGGRAGKRSGNRGPERAN